MSYPGSGSHASSLTAEQRRSEADRCLRLLNGKEFAMTYAEQTFIADITDGSVSPKQLFWLRDLVEKYA